MTKCGNEKCSDYNVRLYTHCKNREIIVLGRSLWSCKDFIEYDDSDPDGGVMASVKGEIRFIRGRPKFKGAKYGLPQPLSIVIFRPSNL